MEELDVVIIGAGIVGASCAYQLTEAGLSCVVVEREVSAAMGSTSKSTAVIRAQYYHACNIALSLSSLEELRSFEDRFGVDSGYRPVGYLYLIPPEMWDERMSAVELQRSLGVPVEVLTSDEARVRFVDFEPSGISGATFGPADGFFDPHAVTHAYLAAARHKGCQVRFERKVNAIEQQGDGRWQIIAGDDRVRAERVLNTAGCWAGEVARLAGLDVPVRPLRRSLFVTAPRANRRTPPNVTDYSIRVGFHPERDRLLFGRWADEHVFGFLEGIDWDWLEPTITALESRFPWFADESLDHSACWWGYYEMSPDENPIVGASPDATGWFNACGFSGHGVMHGPAIGRVIREEVVDGRSHTIDIEPLRIERFRDQSRHAGARPSRP